MRTAFRIVVWFAVVLVVVAAGVYAALPWLVAKAAQPVLARYGFTADVLEAGRPAMKSWAIRTVRLSGPLVHVELDDVRIEYTVAGLIGGRAERMTIARMQYVDDSETSSGFTIPERFDVLWDLVPVDNVDLPVLEIRFKQPEVSLLGSVTMDDRSFDSSFAIESSMLPAPLTFEGRLDRAGPLDIRLGAAAQPAVVSFRAVPDPAASLLRLDGTVGLEGATLGLLSALVGAVPESGRLRLDVRGDLPWPLPEVGLVDQANVAGAGDLAFIGIVPGHVSPVDVALAVTFGKKAGVLDLALAPGARVTTAGVIVEVDEPARFRGDRATASFELLLPSVSAKPVSTKAVRRKTVSKTTAKEATLFGVAPERSRLRLGLRGKVPWPLPETGAIGQTNLDGDLELTFVGAVPGPISPVDLSAAATFTLADGELDLSVAPGGFVTAAGATVALEEVVRIRGDWVAASFDVAHLSVSVKGPALEIGETLQAKRLSLVVDDIALTPDSADATATIETELVMDKIGVVAALVAQINRRGDVVKGNVTFAVPSGDLSMPVAVTYSLAQGRARIAGKSQVEIKRPLLATTLSGWTEPADLTEGLIEFDVEGAWDKTRPDGFTASGNVALSNVGAHWMEYLVRTVGGKVQWSVNSKGLAVTAAPLTIGLVDVGMPITDIVVQATCCDAVNVQELRGKLLGGSFVAAPFVYDVAGAGASVNVALDGLSLMDVVALQGGDVTATGTLDGQLPVNVEGGQVAIKDGRVVARPPGGHIVYKGAESLAASAGQPGLDFALRALSDFTFEQLEADVDYLPDGTLALGVRLRGQNPSVEKNRKIQYNLNLTQNVLKLLESLRLADRVGESIEKRLAK